MTIVRGNRQRSKLFSVSKRAIGALVLAATWLTPIPPLQAHHSAAMFDADRTVTLVGTVKQLQLTNPHSWLQLIVTDEKTGKPEEWSIELGSANMVVRSGIRPEVITPGLKVTVEINPLKNGSFGGNLRSATLPDGKQVGGGPPGGLPGPPATSATPQ